jgi:putative chitinase
MADVLTSEAIAAATGRPVAAVAAAWPELRTAAARQGITDPRSLKALAATVDVETAGTWRPLAEYGDHPEYDTGRLAQRLGNTPAADGDGQRYEGRGYIQLTGRANYTAYSGAAGVDLLTQPDALLQVGPSAAVAAAFWRRSGADAAARAGDWADARRRVNGGWNGYPRYAVILARLGEPSAIAPIVVAGVLALTALALLAERA